MKRYEKVGYSLSIPFWVANAVFLWQKEAVGMHLSFSLAVLVIAITMTIATIQTYKQKPGSKDFWLRLLACTGGWAISLPGLLVFYLHPILAVFISVSLGSIWGISCSVCLIKMRLLNRLLIVRWIGYMGLVFFSLFAVWISRAIIDFPKDFPLLYRKIFP